jgi:hypothetical protein
MKRTFSKKEYEEQSDLREKLKRNQDFLSSYLEKAISPKVYRELQEKKQPTSPKDALNIFKERHKLKDEPSQKLKDEWSKKLEEEATKIGERITSEETALKKKNEEVKQEIDVNNLIKKQGKEYVLSKESQAYSRIPLLLASLNQRENLVEACSSEYLSLLSDGVRKEFIEEILFQYKDNVIPLMEIIADNNTTKAHQELLNALKEHVTEKTGTLDATVNNNVSTPPSSLPQQKPRDHRKDVGR